jgi:fructokinase
MTGDAFFGGIEAGGTKFICMVGRGPTDILQEARIETTTPEVTLPEVIQFFRPYCDMGQLTRIGVASFGPLDLDPASGTYGYLTSTPKPGWSNTNLVGAMETSLPVKVMLDTDVNAAALAEFKWGAGVGVRSVLYLTIGTGIGGGFVQDGRPLRGELQHPEMGHILIRHDRAMDPFPGICPFHGDCFEGLASGPAIARRLGTSAEDLPDDHAFWDIEANYIAHAVAIYILVLSPGRIVLGGGVMRRAHLYPKIRQLVLRALAGYVSSRLVSENIPDYIVAPGLGERSGVLGALALAARAD